MSMLSSRIRIKKHPKRVVSGEPETIQADKHLAKPVIKIFSYSREEYFEEQYDDIAGLDKLLEERKDLVHWIDVRGLGNMELLQYFERKFTIHNLVIEDIVNTYQRPKLDEYDNYLFATSRMIYLNGKSELVTEQVSFVLFDKVLISFQENNDNTTNEIVARLKGGKGVIRTAGPSFMMYTFMDVIIDRYFALLYKMGDNLDTIEELLYSKQDKDLMIRIHDIKRVMITIRRAVWPERDKINDILRTDSPLVAQETKTFFKDAYDHCMQVVDLVESFKDVTTTLVDMNLGIQSNRMNEIMKVLTIISSIFIPLTFIAGVYGMNFAYTDPETGKILHRNMPELYSANGYVYSLCAMAVIALIQIIYFWRKGWFR